MEFGKYVGSKANTKLHNNITSRLKTGAYNANSRLLESNLSKIEEKIEKFDKSLSSVPRVNTRRKYDEFSKLRNAMQTKLSSPELAKVTEVINSANTTSEPDIVTKALSAIKEENDSKDVTIKPTLAQGDCFYSAIFRSLKERNNLLESVSSCLSIDFSDETAFIKTFRDKLADNISEGHLQYNDEKNGRIDTYDYLVGLTGNIDDYHAVTNRYPQWFNNEFGRNGENLGTRESFCQRLAYNVRQPGEWVGEIEVRLITDELAKCKVKLEIRTNKEDKLYMESNGMDVIHLYNPSEQHYTYFSFTPVDPLPILASPSISKKTFKLKQTAVVGRTILPIEQLEGIEPSELDILRNKYEECNKSCLALRSQINIIESQTFLEYELKESDTLIDLLEKIILQPESASPKWDECIFNLINISTGVKGKGRLRGGSYFEAIFQLAIAIGVLPQFRNKFVRFYDIPDYKRLVEFKDYLHTKPVKNEGFSETGISDISFEVSDTSTFSHIPESKYECGSKPSDAPPTRNPLYFISVKGFKREKNVAKSYDIPILDRQLQEIEQSRPKHIMVCVRNKEKFLSNLSRTRIDFIKNSIKERVIGYEEVIKAFSDFRISFFSKLESGMKATKEEILEKIKELYPRRTVQKGILSLYFHQELVVNSVINRLKTNPINDKPYFMCVGVLPRGGKSFIAGGIIDAHRRLKPVGSAYNILFLTSAINETRAQFKDDLVEMFSEFDDFNFVDVVLKSGSEETHGVGSKKNNFYFVSRQLSSLTEEVKNEEDATTIGEPDMLQRLERKLGKRPEFDICFFDEAHVGISSKTVRKNFQKTFEEYKMPIILMTATYKAPAKVLDSALDLFVWDLQDIKDMKSLPSLGVDGFIQKRPDVIERYPEVAEKLLRSRLQLGQTLDQLAKPYINFPNPNFISLTFTPSTISNLLKEGQGYSYDTFFTINQNKALLSNSSEMNNWHSLLVNKEHALKLRDFMTPQNEKRPDGQGESILTGGNRKYRALNQIFSIAQAHGGRPMQSKPFSILMFMPFGKNDIKIGELCRIWASFMYQSPYWRENFVFLTLSVYANHVKTPHATIKSAVEKGICHREDFDWDLKKIIIEVEREALKQGKGLVILSGDVAKMGISLPCVDVVFLMTSNQEADDIIQKMYRALTDNPPYKKDGFIVDLDVKRVIKAMFEYDIEKDKMRITTKTTPSTEERLMKTFELCNWGQDAYTEDNPDKSFNDIMDEIKRKVISDLKAKIQSEYGEKSRELDRKQVFIIRSDRELIAKVNETLQNTAMTKEQKKKAQTLAKRGESIPAAPSLLSDPKEPDEAAEPMVAPPKLLLIEDDIDKKIMDILKTFINTIVIKSVEPFSKTINLSTLLNKYEQDKRVTRWPVECECSTNANCKKHHDNIYEAVACELKAYARTGDSEKSEYNEETHRNILLLIDEIFKNSELIIDWNIYAENLLREINESKSVKNGGRFNITRKKYRY